MSFPICTLYPRIIRGVKGKIVTVSGNVALMEKWEAQRKLWGRLSLEEILLCRSSHT